MQQYEMTILGGHILADAGDGLVLIDTGSPMSFHEEGSITLCGETFPVPTSLMRVDAAYLSEKVGAAVRGLVGMDLIGRLSLVVDVPGKKLTFGAWTRGWTPVPSSFFMGVVTVDLMVDGRTARVALDTGAPTSYIAPRLVAGRDPVGTAEDFSPFAEGDSFEAPLYEVPVSFGGETFKMRLGVLPAQMRGLLSAFSIEGAVGMELLRRRPLLIAEGGVWTRL